MKRLLFALAILLISNVLYAQFPYEPGTTLPAGNLVAWYPSCGDTIDHGPTGYHLNNLNITYASSRFGAGNAAWLFNGANSNMHYTTTFPLSTLIGNIGYSIWIYPTGFQNSVILHNGNPNSDGIGMIMSDGAGGPGNVVSLSFPGFTTALPYPVTINQWHHLVMTRTGNGFYFYVDTVQVGFYVPPVAPGFNPVTTVFQVGIDNSDGTNPFQGRIDDIAIYDRLLGPGDVRKLYHYTPDINFDLGLDKVICEDTAYLYPDTTAYKNALYYGITTWYDYSWSTTPVADNRSMIREMFIPGVPAGPITRTLTISRQYSCPKTDNIRSTHVTPALHLGADTIFCSGNALILDATGTPGSTYLWSTGATSDTIPVTVTGDYWVQKDSIVGSVACIARDTIHVNVAPPVHVTLHEDDTLCQGGSLVLYSYDSASYGTPTYQWSDGITTTPTFNVTVTGSYSVVVTDSTCKDTGYVNIVIVYDTVTVFTPDTAVCKGSTFVAAASASSDISYQWTPTTGIPVSNISTPTVTPDTSTWYVLTATILNCHIRDSFFVDVQPNPVVNMHGNRNVCEYDSIHITPTVTPAWYTNYIYDWTPGTFLDDSTAPSVVYTAGDTTKLILTVTTPAGCKASDSIIIFKYNANFASMSTDTSVCPGDSIKLFPMSTEPGVTSYVWHPGRYIIDSNAANPVIRPINSIDYMGVATSQYGCRDTLYYSVVVNPAAVITLEDSVVLYPGESYHIEPTTNTHNHAWFPDIGLNDTSIVNPVATPPVSTKYILTATTEKGCIAQDSINIRVEPGTLVTIPNAFLPGNGFNGTIRPIVRGLARLRYFRVYNRWGAVVFEATNIANGWDGTLNGTPQPAGVYVYEVQAVTSTGQIVEKQGNITLLR